VATRGEQLTGNAGALLLRETDHRLGLTRSLVRRLSDPRNQAQSRHSLASLVRTRLLLMALGFRDQRDVELVRKDPALRVAASTAAGLTPLQNGGLASQPTMSRLIDALSIETNLHHLNESLMDWAIACGAAGRGLAKRQATIDLDSVPIEVHGHQPGSSWNGHYGMRCYHPLIAMLDTGHWIGLELRPGNTYTATGCEDMLAPLLERIERETGHRPRLRADAGFPSEGLLSWLEAREVPYVFRVRNNSVLDRLAEPFLHRPPGRPPLEPRQWVYDLTYRAKPWSKERRVVLVVLERKDELFLHHFFLVTNATPQEWSANDLLADYRQRGTMEGHLAELQTVLAPALSCTLRGEDRSNADARVECRNAATFLLYALAYNLAHAARLILARAMHSALSLDRLRKLVLNVPALVVVHARRATIAVTSSVARLWTLFVRALPGHIPRVA
jgi:hypothetical protein